MKILHILSSNIYSGAENVVCQIIKMTEDVPGIQMVYSSPDGTIRRALKERNITYVPLRKMGMSDVKKVIAVQKPDIIHAHDMRACFITSLVCGNIPLICHIHNNAIDSRGVSIKSILFMHAAKKAKHIFWVSESALMEYRFSKRLRNKSSLLTNIIDPKQVYGRLKKDTKEYSYDVLFVGRLKYPKNPQRFVEIVKLISQDIPDISAAVVGEGEELDKLERFPNIDFLGFMSNPAKIIYDSKVLLVTSDWEGTPMVALEAMALGTPIVSTPVDGMKEIIEDGQNGYLSDDNTVLAQRVKEIVQNSDKRNQMSDAQEKKAKQILNVDRYKKEILAVYEKCSI